MRLLLSYFYAQPKSTFRFRRTARTAIKCAYDVFQSLRLRRGQPCYRSTKMRPMGQNVPRAHRSSCAPFLRLNECLPPFEARLASRFAALVLLVSRCMPPPECIVAGPLTRNMRDGPERSPSGETRNLPSIWKRCLPTSKSRQRRFAKYEDTTFRGYLQAPLSEIYRGRKDGA